VLLPFNTQVGLGYGQRHQAMLDAFIRDVKDGLPPFALAYRYSELPDVVYPHPNQFISYMLLLRQADVGEFAGLESDPPFHEVALTRGNSVLENNTVTLNKPQFTYAIRITCYFPASDTPYATWHVYWTSDAKEKFNFRQPNARLVLAPRPSPKT